MEITSNKAHIVPGALDAALRAALGATCFGLSYDGQTVRVHLSDAATLQQQALAESIVMAHNPAIIEAVRDGTSVTVTVWLPDTTGITGITFTVEGDPLPEATPLSADQRGGLSGSAVLNSAETISTGVQGYAHEEVHI